MFECNECDCGQREEPASPLSPLVPCNSMFWADKNLYAIKEEESPLSSPQEQQVSRKRNIEQLPIEPFEVE